MKYFVYILSSFNQNVIYTGVTQNLVRRVYQHKNKLSDGFTKKYQVTQLIYFESYDSIDQAIQREKEIKRKSRKEKERLIYKFNSKREDLYKSIL